MGKIEEIDQEINVNVEHESSVPCSICLDLVMFGGERSTAKLQCGHKFHLDCIGSAFNTKGMMQCPNCRKIEGGRWLYGSGAPNSSPAVNIDDGASDNHPFHFTFTEMPHRVHICPFRGVAQVHPSSESSIGMMSTLTPMVSHQHGGSGFLPHGWLQFHNARLQHPHPVAAGLVPPINNGGGRFDTQRSLPRFMPSGRVYEPSRFSVYGDSPAMDYSHAWVRDSMPHVPLP